ncbi:TetR/AcrR family transcriptional regulator [Micromonospora maris]|uniref:TetR regulatory protein n=2 Tax=Micromonospora maris TaxID=1003110 RepID=F4F7F1_MICM1|nr:TetR/AcrR family transcriptional regulator [Micromonospora maris]AEB44390.1 TetR family transcriptional regulator [Micromonospora maris AB-18-032]AEK75505.1 TetR regulatory protein [Micromonospora maris AB-18-032]KUJ43919.1 TetR family transcriptional regulator [Micromonospora maris]
MTERDTRNAPRGRLDKRQAIIAAALRVFAREGYGQASLDTIAAEAGVAKPTIYNHLGGKENLFRHVLAEIAARSNAKTLAALQTFPTDPQELRDHLNTVGLRLAECFVDEQSSALRRLLHAEIARFPDLFDVVLDSGPNQATEALAGRLARLANAGYLTIEDPIRAARQFVALLTDELPAMTALGTRPINPDDLERAVTAGVDTFLRAFATPTDAPADPPAREAVGPLPG